jgi:hypothetical protein
VLVAGGGRLMPAMDYLTAEIYSPPYLFKGPRPTVTDVPPSTTYGSSIRIQTPDASKIASVALLRLASNTHAYDNDQRYVDLRFSKSPDSVVAQSPANANLAPPGYYMLFVVDADGVPSVARFIQVLPGSASSATGTPTSSGPRPGG